MPQPLRTFIALELPPPVVSLLKRMQEDLKSKGLRAKWVQPESIHLTVKFLGNIAPGDVERVYGAMQDAGGDFAGIHLVAGGVGLFPGIKRPRVIWAGLGGQVRELIALKGDLEDSLATLGFKKETRPFKAHLTLGRFKENADPNTHRQVIGEYASQVGEKVTARRMVLFKSDLTPTGAVYSRLQEDVLKDA